MPRPRTLFSSFSRCRQRAASRSTSALVGRGRLPLEIDADGERPDARRVAAALHLRLLAVGPRLEVPVHGLQEVLAVVAQVEADQVVAEQAVEQLLLPGEGAERLRVGPGDVPELGHGQGRVPPLEHPRQEPEMVVLDEDEGRPVAGLLEDRLGEQLVHLAVGPPVAGVEDRPREDDVAEGPQAAVGQAVIIALLLLLGQPDPAQGVPGVLGRDPDPVVGVNRQAIGVPRAVRHPGAAAGEHHRVERRGHPAGGPHALDDVADVAVDVRLAVGDDDEPLAPQPALDELVQRGPVPHTRSSGGFVTHAARIGEVGPGG